MMKVKAVSEQSAMAVTDDPYLERMKAALDKPAVLKTKLATLRNSLPGIAIFVFEGFDDKSVYAQWIRQIIPNFKYEPFLCGGKKYVLQLKAVLDRDLGNLRDLVYFFVDRDFDDLAGQAPTKEIFLTDRYSLENYIVDPVVLDAILVEELHCHAAPNVRSRIVDIFLTDYETFLTETKEINFLLYCARRLRIKILNSLPEKISKIAVIDIGSIKATEVKAVDIIQLSVQPTDEEFNVLRLEFDGMDPKHRYRGKFAYMFFIKWLSILNEARTNDECPLFIEAEKISKTKFSDISIGLMASRSPKPTGLPNFLNKIAADIAA